MSESDEVLLRKMRLDKMVVVNGSYVVTNGLVLWTDDHTHDIGELVGEVREEFGSRLGGYMLESTPLHVLLTLKGEAVKRLETASEEELKEERRRFNDLATDISVFLKMPGYYCDKVSAPICKVDDWTDEDLVLMSSIMRAVVKK